MFPSDLWTLQLFAWKSITQNIKKARGRYAALFLEQYASNHSISKRNPFVFSLLVGLCYKSEGCSCNERGFVQALARRQYYIVSKGVASELDN